MNKKEISEFEQVQAQLQGLYIEVSSFAKKKPDDAMNSFKLKLINQVIKKANNLLAKRRPFDDFDQFEIDDLPSNSDIVVMISQYLNSLEKLRADNIQSNMRRWYWVIEGKLSDIQTAEPKKIKD